MSNMGRPKSFSTEDIINVIKLYYYHTNGSTLLNASQIAKFAQKELGLVCFAYYTIKRNENANQFMEDLNEKIKDSCFGKQEDSNIYFKSIDIQSYLGMTKEQLKEALINLNTALEATSDKYADILKNTYKMKRELAELEKNSKEIQEEMKNTIERLQMEKKELLARLFAEEEKRENLEQNVKLAWDKEAETILAKTGELINETVEKNTESAVITSPHENIIHLNIQEEKRGRQGFLNRLKELN